MKIRPNLPKYYVYYMRSNESICIVWDNLTEKKAQILADRNNSNIGPYDVIYRIEKK